MAAAVETSGAEESPFADRVWFDRFGSSASCVRHAPLVAEALDQLQAHGLEMPKAAETLGVTATQLARLFKKDPSAWTTLTRLRARAGLAALK